MKAAVTIWALSLAAGLGAVALSIITGRMQFWALSAQMVLLAIGFAVAKSR